MRISFCGCLYFGRDVVQLLKIFINFTRVAYKRVAYKKYVYHGMKEYLASCAELHFFLIRTRKILLRLECSYFFYNLRLKLFLFCSYFWPVSAFSQAYWSIKIKNNKKTHEVYIFSLSIVLILFLFFAHFQPHCSYKIVLIKKKKSVLKFIYNKKSVTE